MTRHTVNIPKRLSLKASKERCDGVSHMWMLILTQPAVFAITRIGLTIFSSPPTRMNDGPSATGARKPG